MTAPRQVIAGNVSMLTRRATQRQHLLRPDATVEQIYLYCLGEAALRYGITLYAWIAMSNHQHVIVRDNRGNLPEFMAHLNKMTAKALNVHWGRSENLWSNEQPNVVHLVEREDAFDKLVYLLANPVADHLVERLADWPGACSWAQHLSGRGKTVKRPRRFFRPDGPMPDEVTLHAEKLAGFEHLSDREWSEKVRLALQLQEEQARQRRAAANRRVLGRKAILRADPTKVPVTKAPRGQLRPHLACRNPQRRAYELERVLRFRIAHRDALLMWIAGRHDIVFPHGTYRMRLMGARCHPGVGAQPSNSRAVRSRPAVRLASTRRPAAHLGELSSRDRLESPAGPSSSS